jgi:hypothetical protein
VWQFPVHYWLWKDDPGWSCPQDKMSFVLLYNMATWETKFSSFKICLFNIDFYFDNIPILWMATGARSHVCGVMNVHLNSCWWLMLSTGPNRVGFYLRTETESSLRNVVFNKKTGRWIMSKRSIIVEINSYQSYTFKRNFKQVQAH